MYWQQLIIFPGVESYFCKNLSSLQLWFSSCKWILSRQPIISLWDCLAPIIYSVYFWTKEEEGRCIHGDMPHTGYHFARQIWEREGWKEGKNTRDNQQCHKRYQYRLNFASIFHCTCAISSSFHCFPVSSLLQPWPVQ